MIISSHQKEQLIKVFEACLFGVVCTNSQDGLSPESAVVAVSYTGNLEIVFGSFDVSRKNKNIQANQYVSLVIGWDNTNKTTVQIEGKAVLLDGEERKNCERRHCQRNPESEKFLSDPRQQYFKVIPHWIRYSNFSVNPQEVWEIIDD
ncbi:MAG: hypothetical protein COV59_05325 [Candidatus Magasanikbacteria bacterium CG11_big_fil_rev_8_21_14_0_20_39_34]|uniref:PI-PLC Y-box domain-containing protein n=1 Tax=Candidatus Magasanikbacteria bacterium CG11_big_fil_rev_8_21_14_0_20_39_34 TaxID=1974653 RepID=A0A2H0N3X0_9BACT|nr:MAG: hypothetical protein COV59_05325 [Candidatus Magasanikbacteria bacterium CG11_big_fil_rev_8_21_14_0_20_39_34]